MKKLSFPEKQELKQPITVAANWVNPNNLLKAGSTNYSLSSTLEKEDDMSLYTLTFWDSVVTQVTTDIPQKVTMKDGDKVVQASSKTKFVGLANSKLGEYRITVNPDYTFTVGESWQPSADAPLRFGNENVLVKSLTYNRYPAFEDVVINNSKQVFFNIVELNEQGIFNNPTISLLLSLIANSGENSYKDVFTDWFETQFLKKDRLPWGASFKSEYDSFLAEKEKADD